ncbi:MAG: GNAT family N-acetyltransferase, partial [Bacteroidota bacterium]
DVFDRKSWDALYGTDAIFQQHAFCRAVENSGFPDISFYYLRIKDGDETIGVVPCFSYRVGLEILAGDFLKKIAVFCRKLFPNFLRPKLFVVGSPVATCENHICLDASRIKENDLIRLGNEVFDQIASKAMGLRTHLTIVKEIPHEELQDFNHLFSNRFKVMESLANSFVPLFKESNYPALLRKRYRSRIKSSVRKVKANGYQWEVIEDFSALSEEMFSLYLNVWNKSKYKFERLTPAFFQNLNTELGDNSFLLSCTDADGQIVCAELVVVGEDTLIPMYLGLGYKTELNADIYNSVIYQSILEAEKRGKPWLVLGQTSYQVKAYNGALFEKTYLGISAQRGLMKLIVKYCTNLLSEKFSKPLVNAYKQEALDEEAFKNRMLTRKFE